MSYQLKTIFFSLEIFVFHFFTVYPLIKFSCLRLELFLIKSGGGLTNWSELVLNDDQGIYEVNNESLNIASEMLERFTSESQVLQN